MSTQQKNRIDIFLCLKNPITRVLENSAIIFDLTGRTATNTSNREKYSNASSQKERMHVQMYDDEENQFPLFKPT